MLYVMTAIGVLVLAALGGLAMLVVMVLVEATFEWLEKGQHR